MWILWIGAFLILCLAGILIFWIGSKVWISIQRDRRTFEKKYDLKEEKDE